MLNAIIPVSDINLFMPLDYMAMGYEIISCSPPIQT